MSRKPTPIAAAVAGIFGIGIAACAISLTTAGEIQLLPAGEFRSWDGRPANAPAWKMNAALAANLIAAAAARETPYVIDYDHQFLRAEKNGQPAPAAGWFKQLEWREGVGLFAVDVAWTDRAREMIESGEYRYISPVVRFDKAGAVTGLLMAAITNVPAIDGMEEIMLAAASLSLDQPNQETSMDDLLEQLRWLLNLPVGSTAEDILAQLQKLTDAIKQDQTTVAAAGFDITAYIGAKRAEIAALSAAAPDPAKWVAIGTMQELQGQVASLSGELSGIKVDAVVKEALASGRLLPPMEAWAREFGAKDLAALSAYLKNAPVIEALTGTQTGGKTPAGTDTAALSADQLDLCRQMAIDPEDFKATLAAESA